MQDFQAEGSWLLEPGDFLYLPPNLAHYGLAQGECMTYSVGFRAPSKADLLETMLGDLIEQAGMQQRFRDAGRKPHHHTADKPDPQDVETLSDMLASSLPDKRAIIAWVTSWLENQ